MEKQNRSFSLITIVSIILLITTGCSALTELQAAIPGFAPQSTATPTSTPTPAEPPTATPTLVPTPAPTMPPAVRLTQGEYFFFTGDYQAALDFYQEVIATTTEEAVIQAALLGAARAQSLLGDCKKALLTLDNLIKTYPEAPENRIAFFLQGRCRTEQKQPKLAAEAYSHAAARYEGILDEFLWEEQAAALERANDLPGAIKTYSRSLETKIKGENADAINIRITQLEAKSGNHPSAIRRLLEIYQTTGSDYTKATANLLLGQSYLALNQPEQAYARFLDNVSNFPRSYDSYSSLVALLDAGKTIDDLERGLVDYFAGQYGIALDAFARVINSNPQHNGTPHYYRALSFRALEKNKEAIDEFNLLISGHPGDRFFAQSWEEKAIIQFWQLNKGDLAAATLQEFVKKYPKDPAAADNLYLAARYLEMRGSLREAALAWDKMGAEYSTHEKSFRASFLSAICYYRAGAYAEAVTTLQRILVLAVTKEEKSAALFWLGKCQTKLLNTGEAQRYWTQASEVDPSGYYGIRARRIGKDLPLFGTPEVYDFAYDLESELVDAQNWVRSTFHLDEETDLSSPGILTFNIHMQRGYAYHELGLWEKAHKEFKFLQEQVSGDALNSFRLVHVLQDLGYYRTAIFAARQVLSLANLSDEESLRAPFYFNHIRFGAYFRELVLPAANDEDLHPFILYSAIRQESLFEGWIQSPAGAVGLMQLLPATGKEVASVMNWPANYTDDDLVRPQINIRLGTRYLARTRDYLNAGMFAALAGYNGGPGNALAWLKLADGDDDLFFEIIRFDETRQYLIQIYEFADIYFKLYDRTP